MKLLHIADLHIGKRLNEMPLIEDQKHILAQILQIAADEKPGAVLIAGDIYDRSTPPEEAVAVFDDFIVSLSELCPHVFVISGNHDSRMRLAFGNRLMAGSGVHFSSVFDGKLQETELEDEYGPVHIWMLPFIKPVNVRQFMDPEELEAMERDDYTGAVRTVIDNVKIDPGERHVLVAHQYVAGGILSDSEEKNIGGLDGVDAEIFAPFDYVALGHLHKAQQAGAPNVYYSGAPLRYSFPEADDEKTVLIAELKEKGELKVRKIPLEPLRYMRVLRGSFDELMTRSFYENTDYQEAFVRAVLTDQDYIPEGIRRLRTVYKNILEISYENAGSSNTGNDLAQAFSREMSPAEYLADFYQAMRGRAMTEEQAAFAEKMIRKIWEGEE